MSDIVWSQCGQLIVHDLQHKTIIRGCQQLLSHGPLHVGRESRLPFSKDLMRRALAAELVLEIQGEERRKFLESAFLELEWFLSDDEYEKCKAFETSLADAGDVMERTNPEDIRRAVQEHCEGPGADIVTTIYIRALERVDQRCEQILALRAIAGVGEA